MGNRLCCDYSPASFACILCVLNVASLLITLDRSAIDCIKLINEEHFLSGSQDGSVTMVTCV